MSDAAAVAPPATPDAGGPQSDLLDFATSVITPGYHHRWATLIVNGALVGLIVTLLIVLLSGDGNRHHAVMLAMAIALLGAINWLMLAAFSGDADAQSPAMGDATKKKTD